MLDAGADPLEVLRQVQVGLAVEAALLRAQAGVASPGADGARATVAELKILGRLAAVTMAIAHAG
jgi:hypothetical protein